MSTPVNIRADDSLVAAIAEYQRTHALNRSAAMKQLLRLGLDQAQPERAATGPASSSAPTGEKRTRQKTVYFADDELAIVEAKASRYGLPVSPFLRRLALEHQLPAAIPEVALLLTELQRQGNNLNQLTRVVNAAAMAGRPMPSGPQILTQIERLLDMVGEVAAPILESLRGPRVRRRTPNRAKAASS